MKVLVTGAAGFMGSHLVDALLAKGCAVFGVDDMSGGYWRNVHPESDFTVLDLRDREATAAYVERVRPEMIFHMAADATEGRSQFTPITSTERNYLAYLNVLVPAIRSGMRKMVLISSMSVYGAQPAPFHEDLPRLPEDIYAIAKAAMERTTEIMAEVHGFQYTIIRPHNVYGERQNTPPTARSSTSAPARRAASTRWAAWYCRPSATTRTTRRNQCARSGTHPGPKRCARPSARWTKPNACWAITPPCRLMRASGVWSSGRGNWGPNRCAT